MKQTAIETEYYKHVDKITKIMQNLHHRELTPEELKFLNTLSKEEKDFFLQQESENQSNNL